MQVGSYKGTGAGVALPLQPATRGRSSDGLVFCVKLKICVNKTSKSGLRTKAEVYSNAPAALTLNC